MVIVFWFVKELESKMIIRTKPITRSPMSCKSTNLPQEFSKHPCVKGVALDNGYTRKFRYKIQ